MICPACHDYTIVVEHKNIELDFCPKCQGIWFDAGELELLLETAGFESQKGFFDTLINSTEAKTSEKKRKCPICRRNMKKVDIVSGDHVTVDICQNEHGIWFDGGEVGSLIKSLANQSGGKEGPSKDVTDFIGTVFRAPQ